MIESLLLGTHIFPSRRKLFFVPSIIDEVKQTADQKVKGQSENNCDEGGRYPLVEKGVIRSKRLPLS